MSVVSMRWWALCAAVALLGCSESDDGGGAGPADALASDTSGDQDTSPEPEDAQSDDDTTDVAEPDGSAEDVGPDAGPSVDCDALCEAVAECAGISQEACTAVCAATSAESCEHACLASALDCDSLSLCLGIEEPLAQFDTGETSTAWRGLAGAFTVDTDQGPWSYEEAYDGTDSVIVLTHVSDIEYAQILWNSSFKFWLLGSPQNVHILFMDVEGGSSEMMNSMRDKVANTLDDLDLAEQCHWQRQIHFVQTPVSGLQGWLRDIMFEVGPIFFAIDRFQRVRPIGLLQTVGSNPNLSFLGYESHYYNFEWDREEWLADHPADTEIVIFDDEEVGSQTFEVEFPPAEEMAGYDTLELDYGAYCEDHLDANCGEWDYLSYLWLCEDFTEPNPFADTACQGKVDPVVGAVEQWGTCAGEAPEEAAPESIGNCTEAESACRSDLDCRTAWLDYTSALAAAAPDYATSFSEVSQTDVVLGDGVTTPVGAAFGATAALGGALGFNSGGEVVIGPEAFGELNGDFTVSAWVYGVVHGNDSFAMTLTDASSVATGLHFGLQPDGAFISRQGTGGEPTVWSEANQFDTWHHLVVAGSESGVQSVYLNGALAGTWSPEGSWPDAAEPRIVLGSSFANPKRWWRGYVDELAVWDSELGADAVAALHAAGAAAIAAEAQPGSCAGYVPAVTVPRLCAADADCDGYTGDNAGTCGGYVAPVTGDPGLVADTLPCVCERPAEGLTGEGERQHVCKSDGTGYNDCNCACDIEIGRWITTYGREGRWVSDHSPFLRYFKDGGPARLRLQSGNPYYFDLKVRLANRGKNYQATELVPLVGTFGYAADFSGDPDGFEIEVPDSVTRVELFAYITGHGFGVDTSNCYEFCNHGHHFWVNGSEYLHEFPEAGDTFGCADQIGIGTVPNQYGTWYLGRGGWCPGMDVKPFQVDVTDDIVAGQTNVIEYKSLHDGQPWFPEPFSSPGGGFAGNVRISSWLVFYE